MCKMEIERYAPRGLVVLWVLWGAGARIVAIAKFVWADVIIENVVRASFVLFGLLPHLVIVLVWNCS